MVEYRTVSANDMKFFNNEVTALLKDGWELHGPHIYVVQPYNADNPANIVEHWSQALTKFLIL